MRVRTWAGRHLSGWGLVAAVAVLLLAPLAVLCVWVHANDHWAPVFDLAMTEVRVRDVGTAHTPLVGLPGRLGRPEIGSHPGPLSFYLLAPVYRLLGGSYWALRTSTAVFNALAIVTALVVARRRGGAASVLGAGLGLAVLELGYGLLVLTEPWNPHLPVLWFVPFLLAVWAALDDDAWMLPVAVAAGSVCAHTHIPYLPVCAALGGFAFAVVTLRGVHVRRKGMPARRHALALLAAVGVAALLWAPPVIEEWIDEPGNVKILFRYFANPPEASVGLRTAAGLVLQHLDAWHIVVDSFTAPSVLATIMHVEQPRAIRGAVFLVLWLAAAGAALRLRLRALAVLHGLIALALIVLCMATSRIIGAPWNYLMFSAWDVGLLAFAATAASAFSAVRVRWPTGFQARQVVLSAAGVAVIAAGAVRLSVTAPRCGSSTPSATAQLAVLAPRAAAVLRRGVVPGTGRGGRYLVTWADALGGGAQGIGLVNELERRGLHAGAANEYIRFLEPHRILRPEDATARVHLASGGFISQASQIPGAVQIAYADPRDPPGRREYVQMKAIVVRALEKLGRQDVIAKIDTDLAAVNVPGLDLITALAAGRMSELGMPAAVFVLPPGAP